MDIVPSMVLSISRNHFIHRSRTVRSLGTTSRHVRKSSLHVNRWSLTSEQSVEMTCGHYVQPALWITMGQNPEGTIGLGLYFIKRYIPFILRWSELGMAIFSCYIGNWVLHIRKKFYTENVVRHCNSLPRGVVKSPSLKGFKRHVSVMWLRSEHSAGLKLGLGDLRVFFSLNISLNLYKSHS